MTQAEILERVRALYRALPRDDMRPSKRYDELVKQIRALTDAYRKLTKDDRDDH